MNAKKKDIKGSLKNSLLAEEKKVEDKFSKAETHFNGKKEGSPKPQKPAPKKAETIKKIAEQLKEKTVRDTFTFPEGDHSLLKKIQTKGLQAGISVNKSEIIRAGLHVLNNLPKAELVKALEVVEKLKVGRKT